MKRLSVLNGLRGISALWVVLAHCGVWGGYKGYNPNAKVAVDIFMMISGFLMMYTTEITHRNQTLDNKKNRWVIFYLRRFFRLSPGYYVSLILAFVISPYFVTSYHELGNLNGNNWLASIPVDFSLTNMFLHFTYVFGLLPKQSFSTMLPDWSLGLEMQFYLIFPLIFLLFRSNVNTYIKIIFCVLTLCISLVTKKTIMPYYSEVSLIIYQLPVFLIGVAIYQAFFHSHNKRQQYTFILIVLLLCVYTLIIKDHIDNLYLLLAAILLMMACSNSNISANSEATFSAQHSPVGLPISMPFGYLKIPF